MRKEVCCFSCIEGGVYRNVSIKKVKMTEKEVKHRSSHAETPPSPNEKFALVM